VAQETCCQGQSRPERSQHRRHRPLYRSSLRRPYYERVPAAFLCHIADGKLPEEPEIYDIAICSFALHLLTESSQLWSLLNSLSTRARYLVVLAPHKKPAIKQEWGWERVDPWRLNVVGDSTPQQGQMGGKKGDGWEIYQERVRLRVWKSTALWIDANGS